MNRHHGYLHAITGDERVPLPLRNQIGDFGFISQVVGRIVWPSAMAHAIAPKTGRYDVCRRIAATVLLRHKMFSGALQMLRKPVGDAMSAGKLRLVRLAHRMLAIKASAILPIESLMT